MVFIPAVGSVVVADISLTNAKKRIEEKIRSKYVTDEIEVALAKLRSFRVTVSGAVYNPGLVEVNAMDRVSDAIKLTGGFVTPIAVQSQRKQTVIETPFRSETSVLTSEVKENVSLEIKTASKRNITVKRKDGTILHADIMKYELTGDLDSNPTLLDGDVIIIPTEQEKVGRVWISGAVRTPDKFEFAPGDRLRDLLEMAHGFTIDADSSKIELVRFENGTNTIRKIILNLPSDNPAERSRVLDFQLQPDDRVYVRFRPDFHEKQEVEIRGEVRYPGFYAIGNGPTRLSEVIEQAGGFTPNASLRNAYVVRQAAEDVRDPEFERLKEMNVADMTEMEREYFKVKSRERVGGMGVDFVALFQRGDKTQDVILRDDDLIVVPAKEMTVNVTGQVINPGLLPYEPNKPLKYYIKEAGGYNWNARKSKIRVIKGKTGEWMKPDDNTIIEVGDTIFVPEKPERDWWLLARDFITVAAQLATIYLVVERATQ